MFRATILVTSLFLRAVASQSLDNTTEVHPKLTTYKCTTDGGCIAQNTALVLESSQHKIYQLNNPEYNCGEWGSAANATICPDEQTCQTNCIIEGIPDYTTHGVYANGSDLTMFMLSANGTEYSPRLYLLNEAEDAYELLHLTGQEFTFDVDMSKLPCGMNSALYLSEMEATGGQGLSDIPVAGAPYGTGYCDAQCYTTPFVNGLVSTLCHHVLEEYTLLTSAYRQTSMDRESAALSWIFGRPTLAQPSSRRTPVTRPDCTCAIPTAESVARAEFVTRAAAQ